MNLPNILTIIRFILVPFMAYFLISQNYLVAVSIYVIACITDILDGIIARKFNQITKLGKLLDPMADKFLQFSALLGLWYLNIIPFWITLVFFLKELFMGVGAIKLLKQNDLVIQSKWFGKLSTIIFFLAIVLSMLSIIFQWLSPYVLPVFILALLSLGFSFIMYLMNYIKVTKTKADK